MEFPLVDLVFLRWVFRSLVLPPNGPLIVAFAGLLLPAGGRDSGARSHRSD